MTEAFFITLYYDKNSKNSYNGSGEVKPVDIFKQITALQHENNRSFALCTVVRTKGSCPRKSGRMLVFEDGSTVGTIGGGPAEWHVIDAAKTLIARGESDLVEIVLDKNQPNGLQMTCGGQMMVHVESFLTRPKLVLIGAGHVNQAIYRLAKGLDFELFLVDDRLTTQENPEFAESKAVFTAQRIEDAVKQALPHIQGDTHVIIATKDNDEAALKALLLMKCNYIGLIGSKRKCQLIFQNLAHTEKELLWLKEVHMPIGLDLGAQTPEEIAISVIAELMAVRNHKVPRRLSLSHRKPLVLIRGAGDLASGVAVRLYHSGFNIVMGEIERPSCIRHTVAFASAVYKGSHSVEGVEALHCHSLKEVLQANAAGKIAVYTGDETRLYDLKPAVFIEATIRKAAIDTDISLAPLTIGLGPGFMAGRDVHAVVETNRGHHLGRVIWQGTAEADTAIPGNIGGYTHERVIKSPETGKFVPKAQIGDQLASGDVIGYLELTQDEKGQTLVVTTQIDGVLRGILFEAMTVTKGFKIADVDPRAEVAHCWSVSDKARAISGGVLEAICEKLE